MIVKNTWNSSDIEIITRSLFLGYDQRDSFSIQSIVYYLCDENNLNVFLIPMELDA